MVRGHLQESLEQLKSQCLDMMQKIDDQFIHVKKALATGDIEEAEFVDWQEKAINKKELLIDKECEKILALYGPVANDLRFILSVIEMNTHLERMGDLLQVIALNIVETPKLTGKDIENEFKLLERFDRLINSYQLTVAAFENESLDEARTIFLANRHNKKYFNKLKTSIIEKIKKYPKKVEIYVNLHTNILTLIRLADMMDNIMEELVFYIEAKVLKHVKKKYKKIDKVLGISEKDKENVPLTKDIIKDENDSLLDPISNDPVEDDLDS